MSVADWIITGVFLMSVVQAASEGFFHEAFGIAGLVFGYLLAAWQYHRLADWFSPYLKATWLAEIAGFVHHFCRRDGCRQPHRTRGAVGSERSGAQFF